MHTVNVYGYIISDNIDIHWVIPMKNFQHKNMKNFHNDNTKVNKSEKNVVPSFTPQTVTIIFRMLIPFMEEKYTQ